jgi:uncharacterized protein (DUF1501 family)
MTSPLHLTRRRALAWGGALVAAGVGDVAFAQTSGDAKFVLVILRGAMDGLAAVPAIGDPRYRALRGGLALPAPGETDGALPIGDGFALHPRLSFLHGRWTAGELAVLHATSPPYRSRSHFDGQDVLETGATRVFGADDGWLNRALSCLPQSANARAVGIGAAVPLVLKGAAAVSNWAPSFAPAASEDTLMRLADLYSGDALLAPTLQRAAATAETVGADNRMGLTRGGPAGYATLARAAANLVSAPDGPACAVVSLEGWDTHANQGGANGALALRLAGLDAALAALKDGMGGHWQRTVVVVATEFGRTVAENGTAGTDHGTGGAAFALGGAVRGGRMLGDWPTLAPNALHEGRDLAPANDLRGLFASVLRDHWGLDAAALRARVFPDLGMEALHSGLVAGA